MNATFVRFTSELGTETLRFNGENEARGFIWQVNRAEQWEPCGRKAVLLKRPDDICARTYTACQPPCGSEVTLAAFSQGGPFVFMVEMPNGRDGLPTGAIPSGLGDGIAGYGTQSDRPQKDLGLSAKGVLRVPSVRPKTA